MRHWFGEGVSRASSRFRLGAVSSVVVVVGLTGAVSAASLGHSGAPSSVLQLSAGTAWFADTQSGYVSLLDSATQSRVSYRSVAPPGDDIAVVQAGIQSGSGAYVVDHTSGQVTRIDGATLEPAGTEKFSQGADTDLAVVSNAASTWVVERNGTLAAEVSPLTLQPLGSPQPVSQVSTEPIVTANGDMWTAGEGGYVYSFAAGSQQSETRPVAGPVTGLVEAAGGPVVADAAGGRYLILDSRTGRVDRTIPADFPQPSSIVVSGSGVSPYVMAVGTADGDLEVTDVNTGWTRSAAVGNAEGSFGRAVISGDRLFVPDYQASAVAVYQVDHDNLTALGYVAVGIDKFNLLSTQGSVWFDDPASNVAGVITPDLSAYQIDKLGGNGAGRKVGSLMKNLPAKTSPTTTPVTTATTSALTTPPTTSKTTVPPPPTTAAKTSKNSPPATSPPVTAPQGPSAPSFTWSPNPVYVGETVTFTDTTKGAKPFEWTFASGSPPTVMSSATASVTWSQPGSYTVVLVTTENGQSSPPATQTVTVYAKTSSSTTTTAAPTTTVAPTTTTTASTTTTIPTTTTTLLGQFCGNLYVSDTAHNRVVEVPGNGGAQTTVIGSGLNSPEGIAVDSKGDVFVADEKNNRVIEVTPGGVLTIGTGLNNPTGVALDAAGDVFIADENNNRVVEVPTGGGTQKTIGTGLDLPTAVAVDSSGNVFIADTGFGSILEVTKGGSQSTVASSITSYGLGVDPQGNLYIADNGGKQILEIAKGTTKQTTLLSGGPTPFGVAADSHGDIWYAQANGVYYLPSSIAVQSREGTGIGTNPADVAISTTGCS